MNILHNNKRYIVSVAELITNLLHNEINKQKEMTWSFLYGIGKSDDKNSGEIEFKFENYI